MAEWQLAQLNVARAVAPLDGPELAEFVSALSSINALAEAAPGFVWRLVGSDDNAPAAAAESDPRLLLNLSVWRSAEALFAYVYKSAHTELMVQRRRWFEKPSEPHMVLWWVPADHRPTLEEALRQLELLRQNGPSARAFTFKQRFPSPGTTGEPEDMGAERFCTGWR